jgi:hypothetical protein
MLSLDDKLWAVHPGKNISLCVVIRTYSGHSHTLGAMLATLAAAVHRKTSLFLIDTGMKEAFTFLPNIVGQFNDLVGFELAKVSRWTSNNSRPLIPALQGYYRADDWGYAATDMVLNDILRQNAKAASAGRPMPCTALYFTNGDNLIGKSFFVATLNAIARGHNIVATNFVDKAQWHLGGIPFQTKEQMKDSSNCGPWRSGTDMELVVQFKRGCVDLGV